MSYYPILSAPNCSGWTTVCNFAPNNWEEELQIERFINLTWTDGDVWRTECLGRLKYEELKTFKFDQIDRIIGENFLPLLSLSEQRLPEISSHLPKIRSTHSNYPAWRASVGLTGENGASACFQGELDPFPSPGSLLTFGSFVQVGCGIDNYLLFLNIESNPKRRAAEVEIRDAANPTDLKYTVTVESNSLTAISLDWAPMNEYDLPLIICRSMSGIPIYFSSYNKGEYLSLEHSHPPASTVIHGQRRSAQSLLKKIWFSKVR